MRRFVTYAQLVDLISKAQVAGGSPPGSGQPLREALAALSTDALTEIKVIIWLGRGDFESWEDAWAEAKEQGVQGGRDLTYIAQTPSLAEYLRVGAKAIGDRLD
jgi:hypothetical protein